jgi:hypothetical protein
MLCVLCFVLIMANSKSDESDGSAETDKKRKE